MEISDKLVSKLSNLCKVNFEGKDKEQIKSDLAKMLDFVGKLNEVDTSEVKPLVHMTQELTKLREDLPVQEITHEEALKNAPKKDTDYFRVPKVVNK